MRWKQRAVITIYTHFRRNRHSKACWTSYVFFYKSSREPWPFIPQTKGGITFSWCLLRKPHSSSRSLSHYRWLWMTGNSVWHLNRVWEPLLLPQQFCCCGVPTASCWRDFSQLSAFCGWSALKDMQLWWLPWACCLCFVVWSSQTLQWTLQYCLKHPCAWFPVG